MKDLFHKIAHKTSELIGSPTAFIIAAAIIIAWAISGPIFGFSDTWQLIINTGTTIVTFLIVFLIQNTQNRDANVMQLKLDELIRGREEGPKQAGGPRRPFRRRNQGNGAGISTSAQES